MASAYLVSRIWFYFAYILIWRVYPLQANQTFVYWQSSKRGAKFRAIIKAIYFSLFPLFFTLLFTLLIGWRGVVVALIFFTFSFLSWPLVLLYFSEGGRVFSLRYATALYCVLGLAGGMAQLYLIADWAVYRTQGVSALDVRIVSEDGKCSQKVLKLLAKFDGVEAPHTGILKNLGEVKDVSDWWSYRPGLVAARTFDFYADVVTFSRWSVGGCQFTQSSWNYKSLEWIDIVMRFVVTTLLTGTLLFPFTQLFRWLVRKFSDN